MSNLSASPNVGINRALKLEVVGIGRIQSEFNLPCQFHHEILDETAELSLVAFGLSALQKFLRLL